MFARGICTCPKHSKVLKGYDVDGVANTAKAGDYVPRFGSAAAHAIADSCQQCLPDQEGEQNSWSWAQKLSLLSHDALCDEMARAATETPGPNAPVTTGLSQSELKELHAAAHRERLDLEPDVEIWLSDSEGAWLSAERERVFRVSETGSELSEIKTMEQAKKSKHWPLFKAAAEEEIHGKMLNCSFEPRERAEAARNGCRVMKSRWVIAIRLNDDNSIREVKMRFVGCGYSQEKGKDFDAVFAATMPGVSFRLLIAAINDEDLETDHIDATKAFTQAEVDRLLYVEAPEGFTVDGLHPNESAYVLILFKALEGIKQGAYLWHQLCRGAMLKLGCKSWLQEVNLYYHEGIRFRMGIFADDMLAGFPGPRLVEYKNWKKELTTIIRCSMASTISPVLKFTGVQIERYREQRIIKVHQERYIDQMAEQLKGLITKQDTPHGTSREDRSAFDKILEDKTSPSIDRIKLLKLLGKIVWPSAMTRPDIAMETSKLCSTVSDPRQCHYDAALVVAGYLWNTKSLGIEYGGKLRIPMGLSTAPPGFESSSGLYVAHDSSWGTSPRPLGGYVIMYCNGALDWSAKLIKIIPDSTCEAETALASRAAKSTCFVRGLVSFHKRPVSGPTPALGDNQAMYTLVTQEGATTRTRYYERATLLIKRAIIMLLLAPYLIKTQFMIADMFTKALDKASFIKFRDVIMNNHVSLKETIAAAACKLNGNVRRLADHLYEHL